MIFLKQTILLIIQMTPEEDCNGSCRAQTIKKVCMYIIKSLMIGEKQEENLFRWFKF